MQINLIIEENIKLDKDNKEQTTFNIYMSNELLKVCESPEEVEGFLGEFQEKHSEDSVILRFS